MCGINAVHSFNALHKACMIAIEQIHRGFQGTGLAYIHNNSIKVLKEPIDPKSFYNKYKSVLPNNCNIAICHNRMPSQGKVNMENTHPFLSCNHEFAFIHNGNADINNVRKILEFYGHKILGQTDSEILTHVLEIYYWQYNDWLSALEEFARDYLGGSIIILTKNGVIYGVRNRTNPLVFVRTNKGLYLASELDAISSLNEKIKEKFSLEPYKPIKIYNNKYEYKGEKREIEKETWIPQTIGNIYVSIRSKLKKKKKRYKTIYDKEWLDYVWDYP